MHYIMECPMTARHFPKISAANLLFNNKNLLTLTQFLRVTNLSYDVIL